MQFDNTPLTVEEIQAVLDYIIPDEMLNGSTPIRWIRDGMWSELRIFMLEHKIEAARRDTPGHIEFLRRYIAIRSCEVYLNNNCDLIVPRLINTKQDRLLTEFINGLYSMLTREVYNKATNILEKNTK